MFTVRFIRRQILLVCMVGACVFISTPGTEAFCGDGGNDALGYGCDENQCFCPGRGQCMPSSELCCGTDEFVCNGQCAKNGTCCPGAHEVCCNGRPIPDTAICLLQPPPGVQGDFIDTDYSSGDPFQYWQKYLGIGGGETLWTWGLWMGAGLAVLNVVVAGFQIMGGDTMGMMADGKQRMMWSIVGLLMLMFAGVILNFLNPLFFQAG